MHLLGELSCALKRSALHGKFKVLQLSRSPQAVHAPAWHSAALWRVGRQIQISYRQIGGKVDPILAHTKQTKASSASLQHGFKGSPY